MELTDDAPKFMDVRYFSKCLDKNGDMKERRDCGGLRVGNVVEFDIVLKVCQIFQKYIITITPHRLDNNDDGLNCFVMLVRQWNARKIRKTGLKLCTSNPEG